MNEKCNLCKGDKYVTKKANIPCKSCNETGIYEKQCPACNGTGLFKTKNNIEVFCRKCNGTGIWSSKCNKCNGEGIKKYRELILCPKCKGTGEKPKKVFNGIKVNE